MRPSLLISPYAELCTNERAITANSKVSNCLQQEVCRRRALTVQQYEKPSVSESASVTRTHQRNTPRTFVTAGMTAGDGVK